VIITNIDGHKYMFHLSQFHLLPLYDSHELLEAVRAIFAHVLKHCEEECVKGKCTLAVNTILLALID
jgi:hypothetical protein